MVVTVENDSIIVEDFFEVGFQRTLRIPDDGGEYPLPPGFGHFPIYRVQDYLETVPELWKEKGGVFLPMYQREAMWIQFVASPQYPIAVKVGIGKVNALSGEDWDDDLYSDPQNYLVAPGQPWLDGINSGDGCIKQFVAMPLGQGYTVEAQITGEEVYGGVQLVIYKPKASKIVKPENFKLRRGYTWSGDGAQGAQGPVGVFGPSGTGGTHGIMMQASWGGAPETMCFAASADSMSRSMSPEPAFVGAVEMGLGAGGRMRQKIYPDSHGTETWDLDTAETVWVHLANSELFEQITGLKAPDTPIDADRYTKSGYPWFDLYDEHLGDISASAKLAGVKSVSQMDKDKAVDYDMGPSVSIGEEQVDKYKIKEGTGISKS